MPRETEDALFRDTVSELHIVLTRLRMCERKSIKMSDDEFMVDDDEEYDLVSIVAQAPSV